MQIEQEITNQIQECPKYDITNHGRVFNRATGREMSQNKTQYGIVVVGLMKTVYSESNGFTIEKNVQCTRSVKALVARTFVEGETDLFNTPIQLDGNRENLHASNIVWRPRWFAVKYTRQLYDHKDWYLNGPILDIVNDVEYETYLDAAMARGLLCEDIRKSMFNKKPVFPTWDEFRWLNTN